MHIIFTLIMIKKINNKKINKQKKPIVHYSESYKVRTKYNNLLNYKKTISGNIHD